MQTFDTKEIYHTKNNFYFHEERRMKRENFIRRLRHLVYTTVIKLNLAFLFKAA